MNTHAWNYSERQIEAFVKESKQAVEPDLKWRPERNRATQRREWKLELMDSISTANMRYIVHGVLDMPSTYEAAFLLDNKRVRGIGYNPVLNRKMYGATQKKVGWHENVVDYETDGTKKGDDPHTPLDISPNDMYEFNDYSTKRWNIANPEKERGLL